MCSLQTESFLGQTSKEESNRMKSVPQSGTPAVPPKLTDYPKPGSEEAIAKGCSCDPDKQDNPNWAIVNPKCSLHGNVQYLMWATQQGRRRKTGA